MSFKSDGRDRERVERVERTGDGRERSGMFEGGFYCCTQGLERVCFRYGGGLARLKKKGL